VLHELVAERLHPYPAEGRHARQQLEHGAAEAAQGGVILERDDGAGAARDGVDVRVLVPSRWDHFWLRSLMVRSYRRLLRNGVRIWEWRGEMMHAKSSVVDGRWLRIGSTDFNPLGVAINYELDAVIEDAALGTEAEELFLEDLKNARELTLRTDGEVVPRAWLRKMRKKRR